MKSRHIALLTILLGGTGVALAAPTGSTYIAFPDAKGFVSLFDTASVERTADGFSIRSVTVGRDFPHVFGSTAYRVETQRYHCRDNSIDLMRFAEYDSAGKLLDRVDTPQRGIQKVVAHSENSAISARVCPAGVGKRLPGVAPLGTITAATDAEAYRAGRALLKGGR